MYEREQEESGSRNHPIHHHRIGFWGSRFKSSLLIYFDLDKSLLG